MHQILKATYQDGKLILEEKLSIEEEGKKLQIILLEEEEIESKKERFFKSLEKHSFTLPENYQFNRDAIYER